MTTIEEALRKELASLREQHSNVLRENECQRQELASNKLVIDQLAHERNDTRAALEAADTRWRDMVDVAKTNGFESLTDAITQAVKAKSRIAELENYAAVKNGDTRNLEILLHQHATRAERAEVECKALWSLLQPALDFICAHGDREDEGDQDLANRIGAALNHSGGKDG